MFTKLDRIDLRGKTPTRQELRASMPRGGVDVDAVMHRVRPMVEDVAARGVTAALEYGAQFDGVRPQTIRVPRSDVVKALDELDPQVRAALETSMTRARQVHSEQRRTDTTTTVAPGGVVTERWVPVERVGLYVPGGNAVYPSSVIMNVVPAQEAGVDSLVVASPPQKEWGGLPHPTILAACAMLGVDEVWAVGGGQGVALLAYGGVDTDGSVLDPVDMVTGPGNVYVTAAKRLCRSVIGIDSEAGPTEIAVFADSTADPVHVAADLISQAEHDVMASSVLVTTSEELADEVDERLHAQIAVTRHRDRVETALSGKQSGVILVSTIEQGIKVCNTYAAEHLEIHTIDAAAVANRITCSGAIFVGPYAPVSLGDYCAGSNHVLPTAGCARHSSGLSVHTFLKSIHIVEYDQAALKDVSGDVITLAHAEDLPAHGEAVRLRFESLLASSSENQ